MPIRKIIVAGLLTVLSILGLSIYVEPREFFFLAVWEHIVRVPIFVHDPQGSRRQQMRLFGVSDGDLRRRVILIVPVVDGGHGNLMALH